MAQPAGVTPPPSTKRRHNKVRSALRTLQRDQTARVTYADLTAELLRREAVTGDTWLAEEVTLESDLSPVEKAVAALLSAQPSVSPWADAVGPTYLTAQVMSLLGIRTRQALHNRVTNRSVLAMTTADGHRVYPAWQFQEGRVVAGLSAVLKVLDLGVVDSWTLASWLRLEQEELDSRSVAQALLAGDRDDALTAARRAAVRWAR